MKPLPTKFDDWGWTYTQVVRTKFAAVYFVECPGRRTHWDAFEITHDHNGNECYPMSKDWDVKAWTYSLLNSIDPELSAIAKMNLITDKLESGAPPLRPSVVEAIQDLIRACGAGLEWLDQISRGKVAPSTRGPLEQDRLMCANAIAKARKILNP